MHPQDIKALIKLLLCSTRRLTLGGGGGGVLLAPTKEVTAFRFENGLHIANGIFQMILSISETSPEEKQY